MSRIVARALILGVLAALFWQWRFLSGAPATGRIDFTTRATDLYTQYIPVLSRAAEELHAGRVPLWNPDQLAGVPMLPSWFQFGALYPLNFLYLIAPVPQAIGWTTCLHFAVAGAGMWWLAAVIGIPAAGAWFAAVVFMLSRPFAPEPNLFHAMALAPAVLASWWRLATAPGARTTALAAALFGLQISTGGTQMVLYTAYAAVAFCIAAWWSGNRTVPLERVLARGAAALVLAAGVTAVFLLPASTLVPSSGRTLSDLDLTTTLPFSAPAIEQLAHEMLSPQPGLPRAFFGWSTLALAAFGLVTSKRRTAALAALAVALVGALIVLGPHTPFYELYHRLPTGSWYRVPQRAVLLIGVGVALLAGFGVERLARRGARWPMALVALVAIELFHATWSTVPYPQVRAPDALKPPPVVRELRQRLGTDRVYVAVNWGNRFPYTEKLGTWTRLSVAQDYDALTPTAYAVYVRRLLGSEASIDPIFAGRYVLPPGGLPARRALDLLAVRFLMMAPGAAITFGGVPYVAPATEPLLVRNPHAVPRVVLVHHVETVTDRVQALRRLREPAFNPKMAAVVVGGRPLIGPQETTRAESVEIVSAGDDVLTVQAHVEREGLLVLSDLLLPGWGVTVDGAPAEIVLTNGIFRGVYLEPGDHEVRFVYRPQAVRAGLAISITSALILAAMVIGPQRGRRVRFVGRVQ